MPKSQAPMSRWLFLIALVMVVGIVLRLPAVRISILNEDEALYATAAAAMHEGELPYHAGVESKPPGIFFLYQAGFALVGRYQMQGLHALTILWVLATGLFLALCARRAAGPRAALLAALFYYVFVTVQDPKVLATQCELLFSLPLAAAAALLLTMQDRRTVAQLLMSFAAGSLCALATLIKPTAVSLFLAALAWLVVVRPLSLGGKAVLPGMKLSAAITAGFATIWGLVALYFKHLGVWDDLVYWTFQWTTLTYIPTGFATFSWLGRFAVAYGLWGAACIVLLVLALRAVVTCTRKDVDSTVVVSLLATWSIAAFAGTLLGGRFFDHYFPALVTPLSGLAGIAAASLDLSWRRWSTRLMVLGTIVPAMVCFILALNFDAAEKLFSDTRLPYDDVECYVKEHTRPTDRIFVWGHSPLIYVASDRLAATRYLTCNYLTGYAAIGLGQSLPPEVEDRLGVPDGFPTLVRDLEEHRAELIIDTAPGNQPHWRRYPIERYPLLYDYVSAHYVREAVVGQNVIYRRKH